MAAHPALRAGALALAATVLVGCQAVAGVTPTPVPAVSGAAVPPQGGTAASASPATATAVASATATEPSPRSQHPTPEAPLAGRVIVIDPGHNGVWTRRELREVPSGNGRTKPCNSSGTATNDGYPEHADNWAQAKALAAALRARGARVLLTRPDDHGEGPCVNRRSTLANDERADALVSIHADGSFASGARGFHVIVSTTMAGGSPVEKASLALARTLRHALENGTPMPRSTYIGEGSALSLRSDLGTLNLSRRTAVMLEMGNMRNARDARLLRSASFREKAAEALADGLVAALA